MVMVMVMVMVMGNSVIVHTQCQLVREMYMTLLEFIYIFHWNFYLNLFLIFFAGIYDFLFAF